eukprot:TRINITY_DN8465_c0_g1_i1.p2 TRINITY_DN8465_c0_g1~~TRINITY_DN8465_c0_g1_i1.p2  ORF type:complete len:251 (-),score=52.20 TRINITY_DN8465_c0_g1_i1:1086-1838(-)
MSVYTMYLDFYGFFFSSRRRHTRSCLVSWARRCVQETVSKLKYKMLNKTNRVIDYFTVIGIGQKLQPNNPEEEKINILTDLDIIVGFYNENSQQNMVDNEVWIDFDGTSTLWLKCTYNQKSYGITKVNFYYFKYENNLLRIPLELDCQPVPVKKGQPTQNSQQQIISQQIPQHSFEKTVQGYCYYKGNYDLTTLLDAQQKPGFHLVMVYKKQSKVNFDDPISKLRILMAQKTKRNRMISGDYNIVVPKKV